VEVHLCPAGHCCEQRKRSLCADHAAAAVAVEAAVAPRGRGGGLACCLAACRLAAGGRLCCMHHWHARVLQHMHLSHTHPIPQSRFILSGQHRAR